MRSIVMGAALLALAIPAASHAAPARAKAKPPAKVEAVEKKAPDLDIGQMMAIFDKIFPAQPDPPAPRLALSRTAVQSLFPDGTYARMMGGMMHGIADRFATRLANTITYAWDAACRADYRVPGVEGAAPPDGYLDALAYYDRVVALSRDDPAVYEKISRTNQLLCGPEWLDEPELRRKVAERWDELGAIMGYDA